MSGKLSPRGQSRACSTRPVDASARGDRERLLSSSKHTLLTSKQEDVGKPKDTPPNNTAATIAPTLGDEESQPLKSRAAAAV
jgi:hypothetical protein